MRANERDACMQEIENGYTGRSASAGTRARSSQEGAAVQWPVQWPGRMRPSSRLRQRWLVATFVERARLTHSRGALACVRTVRACVRACGQSVSACSCLCVCGVHLHVRTARSSMGWPHRSTTSCSRKVAASCESADRARCVAGPPSGTKAVTNPPARPPELVGPQQRPHRPERAENTNDPEPASASRAAAAAAAAARR